MKYTASKLQINAIHDRLAKAVQFGDFPASQKCQALLMILEFGNTLDDVASFLVKSYETIRIWLKDFMINGIKSLKIKLSPGRQPKLTKSQCNELKKIVSYPPYEAGYQGGCWNAAMICDLIKKRYGVEYSVKYLPQLMKRIGLSFQKARYMSAKADPEKQEEWINKIWPKILRKAKKEKAMILFGDECSFALWGSLGYTWALKGQQPLVPTNGNRKNLKVFGMIDYFSGKFISQLIEGKLNGKSYITFLRKVLRESSEKVIVIQDGARYHTSKEVKSFIDENKSRLSAFKLPSYSPEYNPIEQVWRKIKRGFTHNVFFDDLSELKETIQSALKQIKKKPFEILTLFGKYSPKS